MEIPDERLPKGASRQVELRFPSKGTDKKERNSKAAEKNARED